MEIDWKKLAEPFPAEDIEWRVQQSGVAGEKPYAMVLAYVTNRAIQQRLDDVVEPQNWRNQYEKGPDDGVLCGISIYVRHGINNGVAEWITKYDGAENTQVEAVKGGLSGAMKRAAVQWGIGRYLYNLETSFVDLAEKKDAKHTEYLQIKKDGKTVWKGYWAAPSLPAWALPSKDKEPEKKPHVSETTTPVKTDNPANQPVNPTLITQDQFGELIEIAKKKGFNTPQDAMKFLRKATGLDDPTMIPAAYFDNYKKQVLGDFSKPKLNIQDADIDLPELD